MIKALFALILSFEAYSIERVSTVNQFSGAPYVKGGRRVMAAGEAPEYYRIEQGDTLYDICDQLLDEPDYWPKLWALNPDIKNPHFIYPGVVLKFYPGDIESPPFLEVVEEDEIVPVSDDVDISNFVDVDLDSVLEEHTSAPDIGLISNDELLSSTISQDFEEHGAVFVPTTKSITIPVIVRSEDIEPLGEILSGTMGQMAAMQDDSIVVESEDGLSPSQVYSVLRESGEIENSNGDDVGYRYEIVGHIKILKRASIDEQFIAKILFNRHAVKTGDIVAPFINVRRSFSIIAGGASSQSDATIVGFAEREQRIGSAGELVLIDKKLPIETIYPIYSSSRKFSKPGVSYGDDPIATVRIISDAGEVSLGMIMSAHSDIRTGDKLGKL